MDGQQNSFLDEKIDKKKTKIEIKLYRIAWSTRN